MGILKEMETDSLSYWGTTTLHYLQVTKDPAIFSWQWNLMFNLSGIMLTSLYLTSHQKTAISAHDFPLWMSLLRRHWESFACSLLIWEEGKCWVGESLGAIWNFLQVTPVFPIGISWMKMIFTVHVIAKNNYNILLVRRGSYLSNKPERVKKMGK